MTTALTTVNKVYQFRSGFSASVNAVPRYPVLLTALLIRITNLATKYGLTSDVVVIDLSKGKAAARKALKGKGGIYVLHNTTTGLFYVGSAQRYFHNDGRLNDYYTPSRVAQSVARASTKVSHDLAVLIQSYGMGDFSLIAIPLEVGEVQLKLIEQTWMLLLPTINRSLSATSNNQGSMPKEQRERMSNLVYIYELVAEGIICNPFYGIKKLREVGVTARSGVIYTIGYNTLTGHLASGAVWKNLFVFSLVLLPEQLVMAKFMTVPDTTPKKGVWVYEYRTKKFLIYEPIVKDCEVKYGISRTHLKRVRKFGLNFNGYLLSNTKLH